MFVTIYNKKRTQQLDISFYREPGSETRYNIHGIYVYDITGKKPVRIKHWDKNLHKPPYPIDVNKYIDQIKAAIISNVEIK